MRSRTTLWPILSLIFIILLSACGAPTEAPTAEPTEAPVEETAAPAMGRISGRIEFQAPPSPASVLYVVNSSDASQWFTRDLGGSDGPTPFEIEVPAGAYQVYARQSDGGPMAAAYLNPDGSLGVINVPAGQLVSEVLLQFSAPQVPCQRTAMPASPDGRFPAVEPVDCSFMDSSATEAPVIEELATIRGRIEYGQAPPTPTTMLYFVGTNGVWYWLEVPGGNPFSTFEWQVKPGVYQLMAFRVGSETSTTGERPAAYPGPDGGMGFITVTAGQVVEDVVLRNVNSDLCVSVPFPPSPDGRFPGLAETCSSLPTAVPTAP